MAARTDIPGRGRGYIAERRVPKGTLALTDAAFPCGVLAPSQCAVRCHHCFKDTVNGMMRCSKCKFARYCGRQCQQVAWKEGHKAECRDLMRCAPAVPAPSILLGARILRYALKNSKQSLHDFMELEPNRGGGDRGGEREAEFGRMAMACADLVEGAREAMTDADMTSADLLAIFLRIGCNSFAVCDDDLRSVGVGVFTSAAFLNHSCHANCVAIFNGTQINVRAVCDIEPGEELTISYIETAQAREARQRELEERYGFTCTCERCTEELEGSVDNKLLLLRCPDCEELATGATQRMELDGYIRCPHCAGALASIPELDEAASTVLNADTRDLRRCDEAMAALARAAGPCHVAHTTLLARYMDVCIEEKDWNRALQSGKQLLDVYRVVYGPRPHPSLALQLLRVGRLEKLVGSVKDAAVLLKEGCAILKVTHGEQHHMVLENDMLLRETCAELTSYGGS